MGYPINQSSNRRAWEDTKKSFHSIKFFWVVEVIAVVLFGYLATIMTPEDGNKFISAAYPAVGAIIGAIVGFGIICLIMWLVAPYKQRNEARQKVKQLEPEFEKPKLFDILCPTTKLGLPINRLPDGSYIGSRIGLGFHPLSILHRGDLTVITHLFMSPLIRFMQGDKGWESTNAIQVEPGRNPFASPRAKGFTWNTDNPKQWELTGLPITLAKDESLTLPMMELLVSDGNEAGNHFKKGETCQLLIGFSIRTDKGFPPLPDQIISLMRSDIDVSVYTKPDEDTKQ